MAPEQRKLAAILTADVVGYSRLMARDESDTLARLPILSPNAAAFEERSGRIARFAHPTRRSPTPDERALLASYDQLRGN